MGAVVLALAIAWSAGARAAAADEAAPRALWFVDVDGAPRGPLDTAEVVKLIRTRALSADSLAWQEGMRAWQPLSALPAFHAYFIAPPPLPPPPAHAAPPLPPPPAPALTHPAPPPLPAAPPPLPTPAPAPPTAPTATTTTPAAPRHATPPPLPGAAAPTAAPAATTTTAPARSLLLTPAPEATATATATAPATTAPSSRPTVPENDAPRSTPASVTTTTTEAREEARRTRDITGYALIVAGGLGAVGALVADPFLPSSANGFVDQGDLWMPAVAVIGVAAAGIGGYMLRSDP